MPDTTERKPRKKGLGPEQIVAARAYWSHVTKDHRLISDWVGCATKALERFITWDKWGKRPWTPEEQKAIDDFGSELKARQDAINREAFEAAIHYMRFHKTAAKRINEGSETQVLPMASDKDSDSLIARMKAAPKFGEAVTAGRLVTGQNTDKTDTSTDDWYREALESVLGNGNDKLSGTPDAGGGPAE